MKINELMKEMIPVVLGILIALFINNCNTQWNDRKYIEKISNAINEELKENEKELSGVIIEHKQLLDTIIHYQEADVTIGEYIGKVKGMRGVTIKNTGWKALINSRIDLMDYKKISILTNIDEKKEEMKIKLEKLLDLIYSSAGSSAYIDVELFKMTINDLLYIENGLLELHQEFTKIEQQ